MPKFIAAIDQGTTSSRCIVYDRNGPVGSAQKEHSQIYPRQGWVEHDPLEIWQATSLVVSQALDRAGVRKGDIAAIGVTNQRETVVLWDRLTGLPYGNAIVWQDTRTKPLCDVLSSDGGQDRFRQLVGLPLATYFSASKLKWMLDNLEGAREASASGRAMAGTVDAWLIWQLTGGPRGGVHVTDVTNASRTMLMGLHSLGWEPSMLEVFGIPLEILPHIVSSSRREPYGMTQRSGPFRDEIAVCGCLGDQQAAMIGQTCFQPGNSKNTYGTGCFTLMNTGAAPISSRFGLLTTLGYRFDGQPPVYALEGSIAVAGSLVQWMRDNLGLIRRSADIENLAGEVADNGGVYFVPAFAGLFAPHWRSDARGVITGLTGYANKAHLARAVLEAVAYQTKDVLDAMRDDSSVAIPELRVDGGMVVNHLLMQFQADLLGIPVIRPTITETTALGAAYAAGLAVGFWEDAADLRRNWEIDRAWEPRMSEDERQALHRKWLAAVDRSLGWEQTTDRH